MVTSSSIKTRLQKKIFDGLGSTVSIEELDSYTTNIYGEVTPSYGAVFTVKGVPYNMVSSRSVKSFGELKSGDIDIVFPDGTNIDYNYRVSFDGVTYLVSNIEKYPLQDDNLAILVRLAKIHN